jgi:outer membrane protein insertion porin family
MSDLRCNGIGLGTLLAAAAIAVTQPAFAEKPAGTSTTATDTSTKAYEIFTSVGVARTSTRGVIATEVLVDPYSRSVCMLPRSSAHPGIITLSLEGLRWSDWDGFCERLAVYLRADTLPYNEEVARGSERLLASTGFFAAVHCTATSTLAGEVPELTCAMSPEMIVREVSVEGDVPFVLLKEDVRRQIFLRPGKILPHEKKQLDDQAERIQTFLERQGYFGSKVTIVPEHLDGGAEPNEALKLRAQIRPGTSVNVRRIRVEGDAPATDGEIDSIFYHYWVFEALPRRFTPEEFDTDIDELTRLLQKKGYPDAHVDGSYEVDTKNGQADIRLKVRAGPKLSVRFAGNRNIDEDDLRDALTFFKNGSSDVVEVENSRKKIIEKYQREGYFAVDVRSIESRSNGGPSDAKVREVTYQIDEGGTAEVQKITFTGNVHLKEDELKKEAQLKTDTSGFLSTGRWIDARIDRDRRALIRLYHQRGFALPGVSVDREIIAPGKLEVKFAIEEGPYRRVASVLIEGAPKELTQKEMRKHMKLVDGAPFVESRLASDRRALLQLLASNGYVRAEVGRKLKMPYKTDSGWVEIEYKINPGPMSVLGGVLVRGNFRTSESVINDELSLSTDDPLDLVRLSEAKQHLRQLGVFSSVELEPLDTWKISPKTFLLADVQERDQRSVDGVFGFRTDELFSAGADFKDNDFLGRAIRLDVSARLSNADQVATDKRIGLADRAIAKVTAPHPLGLPFSMQYSGSYTYEDKPRFKLREIAATTSVFRTLVPRTACDACPNLVGAIVYRLTSNDLTIPAVDVNSQLPMSAQNEVIKMNTLLDIPNQTIARIGPKLTFDRIDSPVDPRSGFTGDLTLELAHPTLAGPIGSAAPFWRVLASFDAFVPLLTLGRRELSESTILGGPVVFAMGLRYGEAHPIRTGESVPLTETFAYGGDLSVRGIQEKASTAAFLGANYLLTSSFELRWYFLQASFGAFQLAALTDAGMVSYQFTDILHAPTVSVGGALRFITPVGPVSVAYAVPVVKPEEIISRDPSALPGYGRIHFAFGYTF